MNILFVTRELPHPLVPSGESRRLFSFFKCLSQDHKIYLLSYMDGDDVKLDKKPLTDIFEKCMFFDVPPSRFSVASRWAYYRKAAIVLKREVIDGYPECVQRYMCRRMKAVCRDMIRENNIQVVCLNTIGMTSLVKTVRRTGAKIIYVDNGLPFFDMAYRIGKEKRFLNKVALCWNRYVYQRHVRRVCGHVDAVAAISDEDSALFRALYPAGRISVLPHAVDVEYFHVVHECRCEKPVISFMGNFQYAPNRDAVYYFMENIMPLVLKMLPNAEFLIIGKGSDTLNISKNVACRRTGYVEDIRPYLWGSAILVAPILSAGGVKGKVLEAMACGIPVVATSAGAQGTGAKDGEEILIADDPAVFAEKVVRLITDKEVHDRIRERARAYVVDHNSIAVLSGKFKEMLQEIS